MAVPTEGGIGATIRISHCCPGCFFGEIDRGLVMTNQNVGHQDVEQQIICARLQELGFAREKHIRLYGEEFELVSNPVPDGDGFAVEGLTSASNKVRRVGIPLTLVQTVQKELARH
jgi:hypothetical protein